MLLVMLIPYMLLAVPQAAVRADAGGWNPALVIALVLLAVALAQVPLDAGALFGPVLGLGSAAASVVAAVVSATSPSDPAPRICLAALCLLAVLWTGRRALAVVGVVSGCYLVLAALSGVPGLLGSAVDDVVLHLALTAALIPL